MKYQPGSVFLYHSNKESVAHPYVIIRVIDEDNVEAVGLTTNKKKLGLPGNIILDKNEAGLEESIVNVANVVIIKISNLNEPVGYLSETRIEEIKNGIEFLNKITTR